MKRCLSLLFLCAHTALAGDPIVLMTAQTQGDTNAPVTYYEVEPERLAAQPKWDPDAGDPPLSLSAAVAKARAWIGTQPHGQSTQALQSVTLNSYPEQTHTSWVYSVNFYPGLIGAGNPEWYLVPRNAFVLLDGSIVEPVQRSRNNSAAADRSLYNLARLVPLEEAHPVLVADIYLRIGHLDKFMRVLSAASRKHLEESAGGATNALKALALKAQGDTNTFMGATFRVGSMEDMRKQLAGVDPKVASLKLRPGVSLVYWRLPKELGGEERGPAFVTKEEGRWRLLLPGMAPENYYDLPKTGAK